MEQDGLDGDDMAGAAGYGYWLAGQSPNNLVLLFVIRVNWGVAIVSGVIVLLLYKPTHPRAEGHRA